MSSGLQRALGLRHPSCHLFICPLNKYKDTLKHSWKNRMKRCFGTKKSTHSFSPTHPKHHHTSTDLIEPVSPWPQCPLGQGALPAAHSQQVRNEHVTRPESVPLNSSSPKERLGRHDLARTEIKNQGCKQGAVGYSLYTMRAAQSKRGSQEGPWSDPLSPP